MGSSSHLIEETTPANLSTVKQLKDKSLTHKLWLILVISTVSGDIFKIRESTASMNSLLLVCVLIFGASAFPQSQSGCGADERGALRQPGDNWQEASNRCRCLASGRPGCTRKFCGDFPSLAEPVESKRDNPSPVAAAGVNFPGSKQQPKGTAVTGQDSNTGATLFIADLTRDVSRTVQCQQAGVSNCLAVKINYEYLATSVQPGDSLGFMSGSALSMKLRRAPSGSSSSSLSYSFSLSDGGEGTVTVRPRTGSVFASVRPLTGAIMFAVESCGQACNVMYQRDTGYFNQFKD